MTVLPSSLMSQLSAMLGCGSLSSSRSTSGSMRFSRIAAEVVSLARPGSSEGGSAPQLIVISWLAAFVPPSSVVSPVPAASPSSSSPPQPAATKARLATSMARSSQKVFVLMWSVLSRGGSRASRWGAFLRFFPGWT